MRKILTAIFILSAAVTIAHCQTVPLTPKNPGLSGTEQQLMNAMQPYKKRVTAVTQSSTTAPVDTAVENNFPSTPSWRYVSTGLYNYRCTGCFGSAAKKFGVFPSLTIPVNTVIRAAWLSSDSISLTTVDSVNVVGNGKMTNLMLEFRTYP